jgi:hypothetical protein
VTTTPGTTSQLTSPHRHSQHDDKPAARRTGDGAPQAQGVSRLTSRIHNRAGITMLVVAARRSQPTVGLLIRVRILVAAVVFHGA